MVLLALKSRAPHAKYVIFPRIDQKSCFKAILTAGLVPVVVENVINAETGEMSTNLVGIETSLIEHANIEISGSNVLCVLSTTSCFAPRQPDLIDRIAVLCKKYGVGHVINNAYGVQCPLICKLINRAVKIGTVDAIVQSTDKNFMVPVGGAIVCCPDINTLKLIATLYPGRASSAPIIDLFITLLTLGLNNFFSLYTNCLIYLNCLSYRGKWVSSSFAGKNYKCQYPPD